MAGMIDKYWGSMQSSNGNIYYEWRDGEGMDTQRAAISANVPWVEILTWNDFNGSYMTPMDDFKNTVIGDFWSSSLISPQRLVQGKC
jgi:hypothetical protein